MMSLTKLRDLGLAAPPAPGRPLHLSAASGLVRLQSFIYVVADDELHLGVFEADGSKPGHLIRLFDGALPDSKKDRKQRKPDLEVLTLLPADEEHPHGALLALGSGSTRNRRMGALLRLDAQGAVNGPPRGVDLTPLLAPLDAMFAALNIEGAIVSGDEVRLFQRGNRRDLDNAVVRYPLDAFLEALRTGRSIEPSSIDRYNLGEIEGLPLCFTDGAALPDGSILFSAAAEDTQDNYNDGPCAGAAIGLIDLGGQLRWLRRIEGTHKIEGIDARIDGDSIRLLLVTDADDPDIPASLFSAAVERWA